VTHEPLLEGLVHAGSRGEDAGAGIGNAEAFEQPLDGAIFAQLAVEAEEGEVHMAGQLADGEGPPDGGGELLQLGFGEAAEALDIDLELVGRLGQGLQGGVEVAPAAFVEIAPLEEDEPAVAVNENGYRLEEGFVEVIKDGAPSGKSDLPLA